MPHNSARLPTNLGSGSMSCPPLEIGAAQNALALSCGGASFGEGFAMQAQAIRHRAELQFPRTRGAHVQRISGSTEAQPGPHRHENEDAGRLEPGLAGRRRRDRRPLEAFVPTGCRYLRALDLGQVGRACRSSSRRIMLGAPLTTTWSGWPGSAACTPIWPGIPISLWNGHY